MSDRALFLLGNIRPGTFANAALAADARVHQQFGGGLTDVFVLHSPESAKALCADGFWKDHLNDQGLDTQIFNEFTVGLEQGEQAVARLMRHLCRCLGGLGRDAKIYFDLTNGTSLQKNILSVLAYIVGEGELFAIDVGRLPAPTTVTSFLGRPEALQSYVALSPASSFDGLARTWLTEVRRFSARTADAMRQYENIARTSPSDASGFKKDLRGAAAAYFAGLQFEDESLFGGAIRDVGRAFESLLTALAGDVPRGKKTPAIPLMIEKLVAAVANLRGPNDADKVRLTANLLKEIRNHATHHTTSLDFGKISAGLALELLFAILNFCDITFAQDTGRSSSDTFDSLVVLSGSPGVQYYFGVDGDDTGLELESLLRSNSSDDELQSFSRRVNSAIRAVASSAEQDPINGTVIFCEGDDLLFRGYWDPIAVHALHEVYSHISGGRTCSIGFAKTVDDTQRALKLAKGSFRKGETRGFRS